MWHFHQFTSKYFSYSTKPIESVDYSRCSSFSINSFSGLLQTISQKFLQQQEKNVSNFLWVSPTHTMVLRLKKQETGLKILFFNLGFDTARTKNILIQNIEDLKHIDINTFLDLNIIKDLDLESNIFNQDSHSCILLSADISQQNIDNAIINQSI